MVSPFSLHTYLSSEIFLFSHDSKDWCWRWSFNALATWCEELTLIRKDPDAGKDWRQNVKGMTEDEMAGWHHWLNGHEFEQAPADGEGRGLACCSPWGGKESDMTEQLNWLWRASVTRSLFCSLVGMDIMIWPMWTLATVPSAFQRHHTYLPGAWLQTVANHEWQSIQATAYIHYQRSCCLQPLHTRTPWRKEHSQLNWLQ